MINPPQTGGGALFKRAAVEPNEGATCNYVGVVDGNRRPSGGSVNGYRRPHPMWRTDFDEAEERFRGSFDSASAIGMALFAPDGPLVLEVKTPLSVSWSSTSGSRMLI